MRIRELYLKNFGKFSDTRFVLSEKIHVFYGKNEYGKSTIYAFIKAMLFGMERGRGRAAGKDEFSRYEPWENPNYYAGILRFSCGGRSFRLERQFDRYAKSAVLICEDDGEELSVEDGDLDVLLGGISRTTFENTAAIGRLTAEPGRELAAELKNYAANYCGTGGGEIDLQEALESLKEKKKSADYRLREYQEKKSREIEKLDVQCRYVEADAEKLEKELHEKEKELKTHQKIQKNNQQEPGEVKKTQNQDVTEDSAHDRRIGAGGNKTEKKSGRLLTVLGILLMLAGIAGTVWRILGALISGAPSGWMIFLFLIMFIVGAVLMGAAFIRGRIHVSERQSQYTDWINEAERIHESDRMNESDRMRGSDTRQDGAMDEVVRRIEWECARIREEWKEKRIQLSNLQEQIEEKRQKDDTCQLLEREKQALELAAQRLKSLAGTMTKEFGVRLDQEASSILSAITDGKYSRLLIDEQLEMYVYSQGRKIPVERLSRGTLEQIYFSLRMASLDILYEEEIPVILDDAFAYYDEKRLKSVLKWLSEQPRQVIIFSCQRREEEILKKF